MLTRCTSRLVVLNLTNAGKLRMLLCTRRLLRTLWTTRMRGALLTRSNEDLVYVWRDRRLVMWMCTVLCLLNLPNTRIRPKVR